MAMTKCFECGGDVSTMAKACPSCGAPLFDPGDLPAPGGRVPYSDSETAVLLSKKKKTSHLLHLILSVVTAGVWVIVWLLVALSNSMENSRIERQIAKGKRS